MKPLALVFPLPQRYFSVMAEVCVQLRDHYKQARVCPLYIATMQRGYLFENAQGDFVEFDRGDRFFVFEAEPAACSARTLFSGRFPSEKLLERVRWEGHDLRVGTLAVDAVVDQALATINVSLQAYMPNDWILLESYTEFATRHRPVRKA